MLGVVASLVSVPSLWLIGGMTPAYAIAFAVGAGALTGLVIPPSLLTEGADRIDPRRSTGR